MYREIDGKIIDSIRFRSRYLILIFRQLNFCSHYFIYELIKSYTIKKRFVIRWCTR